MATITRSAGGVTVALVDDVRLEVSLRDMSGVARNLETVGRALWVARTRAVLDSAGVAAEPVPLGWRAEAYVAGRAAIVARGRSRDGLVELEVVGMRRWRAGVARAGRADTARAIQEAGEALLADQWAQIRVLKRTIWQPGRVQTE
ncbi:hypothetical protein GCM10022255_087370 [Dactylosporangium darangshiense]|uniref:Uncharacterized protein n=1 Tax=Dactylosporangium darangshiense TaxID=579108 RepID=A0ABP8DNM0_9ACTN